jgi:hypothetical protein
VWQTAGKNSATQMVARFGLASGSYTVTAAAEPDTYNAIKMCSSPATHKGFMTPGFIWVADMANLQPGTKYYYQVGDAVRIDGFGDDNGRKPLSLPLGNLLISTITHHRKCALQITPQTGQQHVVCRGLVCDAAGRRRCQPQLRGAHPADGRRGPVRA